jgi:hypothetical protein
MTSEDRIENVAHTLYVEIYESEFCGKNRGRFLIAREDIKKLLDVKRLHQSTIEKLVDSCLELGLVVIDMDDSFAFAETTFVQKWRKVPARLIDEHANRLNQEEQDEFDEDDGDTNILDEDEE